MGTDARHRRRQKQKQLKQQQDRQNHQNQLNLPQNDDPEAPLYSASATAVPDIILPKAMRLPPAAPAAPVAPAMSAKKRKRLDKFIERELKKDERVKLYAKLSQNRFDSSLLMSSKDMGRSKRKGIAAAGNFTPAAAHAAVTSSSLSDNNDDDDDNIIEDDDDDMDGDLDHDLDDPAGDDQPPQQAPVLGIVSRAFGPQPPMHDAAGPNQSLKPTVYTATVFGTTTIEEPSSTVAAPMLASRLLNTKPEIGSALRQPGTSASVASKSNSTDAALSKRQIKRRLKNEAKRAELQKRTAASKSSSDDDSSSDGDTDSHSMSDRDDTETHHITPSRRSANMWSSNVVTGEHLPDGHVTAATDGAPSIEPAHLPSDTSASVPEKPKAPAEKTFFVPVHRSEKIQAARLSLPVVSEEQPIMEAILANDVVILCGETGSGKTTQVPQFLYEAGFGDPSHPMFSGMIGITQPRRVAAVSMARRISEEMGLYNGEVAYQIRYDRGLTNDKTRIKFMTDGILLRELSGSVEPGSQKRQKQQDPKTPSHTSGSGILLLGYSCIIIDEAHERTVSTDVLIGWLTRIVRLRSSGAIKGVPPLKLIIMSATLRVQDFTENPALFPDIPVQPLRNNMIAPPDAAASAAQPTVSGKPPVIKVDGRQHKVVIHYNKRTPEVDYITEAYKKTCKIHTRLPPGGILVFVTGQQEVQLLVKKLERSFPALHGRESGGGVKSSHGNDKTDPSHPSKSPTAQHHAQNASDAPEPSGGLFDESETTVDAVGSSSIGQTIDDMDDDLDNDGEDDYDRLADAEEDEDAEEEDTHVLGGTNSGQGTDDADEKELEHDKTYVPPTTGPVHVLPLYSLLSTQAQLRVFDPPPPGARLIVVATNVAETSLTIPGIRYVVDCGKVKERRYDTYTGMQTFQITWTSKASADQRAGRAGRLGPGHCYRLFSSAVFNDYFESFSKPEILRVPIEDVVLQMKSMGIHQVVKFPFPTPPDHNGLQSAERLLKFLGAIDAVNGHAPSSSLGVTDLGRVMAKLPVSPRFSKMLIVAARQSIPVLPYAIALVAGMSVGDLFVRDHALLTDKPDDDDDDNHEGESLTDLKETRRMKRASYFKVMQTFSGTSQTSDELRMLNAIGAYSVTIGRNSGTSSPLSFCESHFLRPKAMEEVMKLRAQLTNLVRIVFADDASSVVRANAETLSVDLQMPPPSPQIQVLLRQMLLAGSPDKVARLSETAVSGYGKHAMPVYETMWSGSALPTSSSSSGTGGRIVEHHLIHPSSCLYSTRPAPKWIIYSEALGREERIAADKSGALQLRGNADTGATSQTSAKRWLKGCTIIQEPWISDVCPPSLVRTGHILDQPEPRYDAVRDVVVGYIVPVFGPQSWELGMTETTKDLEVTSRVAWFARALLEGNVSLRRVALDRRGRTAATPSASSKRTTVQPDVFGVLVSWMSTKPSVVTKPWARHQSKVQRVLDTLTRHGITTRRALAETWAGQSPNTNNRTTGTSTNGQVDPDCTFLLDAALLWVPDALHATLRKHWPPILPGLVYNDVLHSAVVAATTITTTTATTTVDASAAHGSTSRAHADTDSDSDSDDAAKRKRRGKWAKKLASASGSRHQQDDDDDSM